MQCVDDSLAAGRSPGRQAGTEGRNMLSPVGRAQVAPWRAGRAAMAQAALAALLALLALPVMAAMAGEGNNSLRCGSALLALGDTRFEVPARCGEPDSRVLVSGAAGADSPLVEQWLYDGGSRRFSRGLTFRGTRLLRVEVIDDRQAGPALASRRQKLAEA